MLLVLVEVFLVEVELLLVEEEMLPVLVEVEMLLVEERRNFSKIIKFKLSPSSFMQRQTTFSINDFTEHNNEKSRFACKSGNTKSDGQEGGNNGTKSSQDKRGEIEIVSKQLNFPSLRSTSVRLWSLCSFGCQVTLDWVNNWVVNKYTEKAKSSE